MAHIPRLRISDKDDLSHNSREELLPRGAGGVIDMGKNKLNNCEGEQKKREKRKENRDRHQGFSLIGSFLKLFFKNIYIKNF